MIPTPVVEKGGLSLLFLFLVTIDSLPVIGQVKVRVLCEAPGSQ